MDHEAARNRLYSYGPRKVGIFLLLVGFFLLYMCAYQPMQDAEQGAAVVKGLSAKGTMVGSIGLMLGLGLLIGGDRARAIMNPQPGESKVLGYVVGTLLTAAGFGIYFLVKRHIEGLGYQFKF